MDQRALRNVNNCWSTNIYFYLETSGGQSSNLYLNVVHFSTPVIIRHLWELKTIAFLHCCLIWDALLCLDIRSSWCIAKYSWFLIKLHMVSSGSINSWQCTMMIWLLSMISCNWTVKVSNHQHQVSYYIITRYLVKKATVPKDTWQYLLIFDNT